MAVSSIGDTYFTNYSTEANDAVSQKMTSQIQDAETDEEMLDACKQFESYLVQQMFKSMEESAKVFSDDDEVRQTGYGKSFHLKPAHQCLHCIQLSFHNTMEQIQQLHCY